MNFVDIGEACLRYELSGSGPTGIVLIHEMGATLEVWDEVVPGLAASRQVLRFDTRGAGLSQKLRGTADIDAMADDIAALLDHCGLTGKVAVAGGAVGAAIALNFALRHPRRTAAIIAMAPAIGLTAERRQATLERAALVERAGMQALAENGLDLSWPPVMRQDRRRFERFRAAWLGNDPSSFAAIHRMLAGLELEKHLSRLAAPCLVLAGRHDLVRPPQTVEPVARAIAGAQFRILDTAHFMAAQSPGLITAEIARFLAAHGL